MEEQNLEQNVKANWCISQFQVIMLGVLVTGLLSLTIPNDFIFYMIQYCPILFFLMCLEYLVLVNYNQKDFIIINFITFIISTPIFFGVYFGIYDLTQTLKFEKVENCHISGKLSSFLLTRDSYTVLYVNFDYDGQTYLGYGCSSKENEVSKITEPYPYKFYFKGDNIQCDSDNRGQTITHMENKQLVYDSKDDDCDDHYTFSKVKIPSWMCISLYFNYEQYIEKQPCYVHIYNNQIKALENSKNRLEPKNLNDFPLISFSSSPYYNKIEVICLIVFTYFPMLVSFNCIFKQTSNWLLENFRKQNLQEITRQREQIISLQKEYEQKQQLQQQKQEEEEQQQQQLNTVQALNNAQLTYFKIGTKQTITIQHLEIKTK